MFGAVRLIKNVDKYKYFGYGIEFDRSGTFLFPSRGIGCEVVIFGVDMSSSTRIYNRQKDTLSLGEGPTEGLEHTLSA